MNWKVLLNNWLHAAATSLALAAPYIWKGLGDTLTAFAHDHPSSVVGIAVGLGALHLIPDSAAKPS